MEKEEAVLIKLPSKVEKKIKDLCVKGLTMKNLYDIYYCPEIE